MKEYFIDFETVNAYVLGVYITFNTYLFIINIKLIVTGILTFIAWLPIVFIPGPIYNTILHVYFTDNILI